MRGAHTSAAPGGLAGKVSHHKAEISRSPVLERKGLADHPADRQPDVMHPREAERVEHGRDVAGELAHRIVARNRVAAAMPAHVEPQHAEPGLQQGRHLLGPAAAVGGERMGDADDRAVLGTGEVVVKAASCERQQHGMSFVT